LNFENIASIGVKSGLYGGGRGTHAPARSIDRLGHRRTQVGRQVVEDHHVPRAQLRH
jgi:hypothetical protein